MKPHKCSQCQSERVVGIKLTGSQARSLNLSTFTILGYEKCLACGAVSEKAAPTWAWGFGLAVGVALVAFFFVALANGYTYPFLPIVAAFIIFGTVRGLVRTLRSRPTAPDDDQSAQDRQASLTAGVPQIDSPPILPRQVEVMEYACVFEGRIPSNGTRAQLTGEGRLLLANDTICLQSQNTLANYTVQTQNARALYHPVTNTFCLAIDNQQWIPFRVLDLGTPAQVLPEAKLQDLLGDRFQVWTPPPETTPAAWGCLVAAIFAIPLLGALIAYSVWFQMFEANNKKPSYSENTVLFWIISAMLLCIVVSVFIGLKVLRKAKNAIARAKEK